MFLIVSDCRIEDVDGIIVPNNKQVKVQLVAPVLSIDERVTAHGTRAEEKNVEVCIHIFVKTRGEEACGIAFWCCDDPTCVELVGQVLDFTASEDGRPWSACLVNQLPAQRARGTERHDEFDSHRLGVIRAMEECYHVSIAQCVTKADRQVE